MFLLFRMRSRCRSSPSTSVPGMPIRYRIARSRDALISVAWSRHLPTWVLGYYTQYMGAITYYVGGATKAGYQGADMLHPAMRKRQSIAPQVIDSLEENGIPPKDGRLHTSVSSPCARPATKAGYRADLSNPRPPGSKPCLRGRSLP